MKAARLVAVLAALIGATSPAHAAVRDVTLLSASFDPEVVHADAGDTIRWTVQNGSHTVTAHGGADFDFPGLGPGDVRTIVFGGGTVLYHCQIHATVDPVSGVCGGMCGAITDRVVPPLPPAITFPMDGSEVDSQTVRVAGTGEPLTTTFVREGDGDIGEAVADEDGIWEVDIQFTTGEHTISARSEDVEGRQSADSPAVTFTVTADQTAPTATISTGNPAVFTSRPIITGTASDNLAVARVEVQIHLAGQAARTVPATCSGCGTPSATWFLSGSIDPGAWLVRARAVDTHDNAGPYSPEIVVVYLPAPY